MRRRQFIRTVTSATAAGAVATGGTGAFSDGLPPRVAATDEGQIGQMLFASTGGLLAADGGPLTDDSLVAVFAESTATVRDRDGDGDAVSYPDDVDIPLVGVDERGNGAVAGVGAMLVNDGDLVPELEGEDPLGDLGNEEFLLNLYDENTSGGTVLWDEGHGQFYSLDRFRNFEAYAEDNGYVLESTTDLTADLSEADAVVITSPGDSFTDAELDALDSFVADGGAVVLHDQSDFNDFDATETLNTVADALGVGFRFNDDQVVDSENNGGRFFIPSTGNFTGPEALFETRAGIDDDPDARTTDYLVERANLATAFAEDRLEGERVTLFFDENEPLRDPTRLLAYAEYDADGDGTRETLYNREVIAEGYGRVYGSTFAKHDEFWALEWDARQNRLELWAESDIGDASPYREGELDEMFFPEAAVLDRDRGRPRPQTVAVYSEPEAARDGRTSKEKLPLFGVDSEAGVAVGGSLLIDESYERLEGFEADTSGFANFPFLTEVIENLRDDDREDVVFIDGGHGQFGVDYALSNEDAAYYQRHLEGQGVNFEQINDVTLERLSGARALIVTTPVSEFTAKEAEAVRSFLEEGGAVVLLGSASAPAEATANLNALADALGTRLRVGEGRVTDAANNVADDPDLPTTTDIVASPSPPRNRGRDGGSEGNSKNNGGS
jgi:hypothetical protein